MLSPVAAAPRTAFAKPACTSNSSSPSCKSTGCCLPACTAAAALLLLLLLPGCSSLSMGQNTLLSEWYKLQNSNRVAGGICWVL
jgi:hypothetical protein